MRRFVADLTRLADREGLAEAAVLPEARQMLARLVAEDDWLPDTFAQADGRSYRQYLLYGDPLDRFSLVSFVWGPGQQTPVHDHLMWGLVGMLRGAETATGYVRDADGRLRAEGVERLTPGMVGAVSPTIGDIHRVANALSDRASISIHLYGGNIGRVRRHAFDPETGTEKEFVSGYSAAVVPNLWG
ncbi:MAG: cysteine dioxygenase [Rhodospirillales bacterium 69-11]|nr:MAG: cysteine dioxygenase [Rhodospirillales bacterium 69-11]